MRFTFLPFCCLFLFFTSCNQEQDNREVTEAKPLAQPPANLIIPEGMIYIPETTYLRGNERDLGTRSEYPEETPTHKVSVDAFLIDSTEATNNQFAAFVKATGYITQAEKGLSKEDFPNAPADQLVPGASIFTPPATQPELWNEDSVYQWWQFVAGANWRHPLGPDSSIEDKGDHPVVCLTNADAQAYAKWAGKRLPTEAEWEAAARGGMDEKLFTWGDVPMPNKQWMGNTFQGTFPTNDTKLDGFGDTSPVKSFPPNAYGLYDMAGNVWEHVSDYYRPDYYNSMTDEVNTNPSGPEKPIDHLVHTALSRGEKLPADYSPFHPLGHLFATKGGSFLCHHTYCLRYRPAARSYSEPLSPTNHTGFRCAKDIE